MDNFLPDAPDDVTEEVWQSHTQARELNNELYECDEQYTNEEIPDYVE